MKPFLQYYYSDSFLVTCKHFWEPSPPSTRNKYSPPVLSGAGCAAPPAPGRAPRPAAGRCRAARPRCRTRAPWSRCSTPPPPGAPSHPTHACRASGTQVISSHLISSEKMFIITIYYNLRLQSAAINIVSVCHLFRHALSSAHYSKHSRQQKIILTKQPRILALA